MRAGLDTGCGLLLSPTSCVSGNWHRHQATRAHPLRLAGNLTRRLSRFIARFHQRRRITMKESSKVARQEQVVKQSSPPWCASLRGVAGFLLRPAINPDGLASKVLDMMRGTVMNSVARAEQCEESSPC